MQANVEISMDFSFLRDYYITGIKSEEGLEKSLRMSGLLVVMF